MLVEEILKKYNLRNTTVRRMMLETFIRGKQALSLQEINNTLEGNFDRTTIYRTLKLFLEKNLLHQVQDTEAKYIFSQESHSSNHAHFKCKTCGNLICLTELNISTPELPKGYILENINLLLKGVCKECN